MESIAHCLSAIRRLRTPEIHPAQHLTSDITTSNETPFASMGAHYFAKLSIQLMKTERVNAIFFNGLLAQSSNVAKWLRNLPDNGMSGIVEVTRDGQA